jgi:hypothetical protein
VAECCLHLIPIELAFLFIFFSSFSLSFYNVDFAACYMSVEDKLTCPSLRWRYGSTAALLFTGTLAKLFLKVGTSKTEVYGLDGFLKLLDERMDIEARQRGLLTGTN